MHVALLAVAALSFSAADTTEFAILNHGRVAGAMRVVSAGDSVVINYDYQDRQRGPHTETHYRFAPDGSVRSIALRGKSSGAVSGSAVSEEFRATTDSAWWHTPFDSGAARHSGAPLYLLLEPNPWDDAALARAVLSRPSRSAALLPLGKASAEVVATASVKLRGGAQSVRLVSLDVGGYQPSLVWLDARGQLFASSAAWFISIRKGSEAALPTLRAAEHQWLDKQSAAVAARLAPKTSGDIVIRNGDVFDSERGVMMPHTTITVHGDRITAVTPDASATIPANATVIDATGKSIIPGLWDMHGHLLKGNELSNGVMQLAAGVTTTRDLASDIDEAISNRARADKGTLLAPRAVLAGFIEGPGFWAGPSATLVRNEAEAREWIARYDSLGYAQIKLYNLVHPDLVPMIAAETHKRGMRLSGHVTRGLTTPVAITLGYDEINHIAFLVSTFFQDSLYLPKMRAYSQVANAVRPTFDADAPRVTELIAFLRAHNTVIDPTLGAFHNSMPLADGSDPIFGRTIPWLPAVEQRAHMSAPVAADEAASLRAGDATYARIVKRLFDAGVTIVAGTDHAAGLPLQGELELYEAAGIPAASVLQIATITAARVMKQDRDYGSISAGKVADLVIINGKPAEHVSDVRNTVTVMRAGRLYDTKSLFAVANVTQRP